MEAHLVILVISVGFAVGSIPFGAIIAKMSGFDLRKVGSGSPGAANAGRAFAERFGKTVGGLVFALVLLLDAGKGALPAFLAGNHNLALFGGFAAVLGHTFSPWLKFRGGKGVATTLGVVVATQPPTVVALALGTFLFVLSLWGYVSLASVTAAAVLPAAVLAISTRQTDALLFEIVFLLVMWAHRQNFGRLKAGSEARLRIHIIGGDHNSNSRFHRPPSE